jgi:hypothetical protein
MKISYLILAHENSIHLTKLINSLDDEGINFFIHIDARSNMSIPHKDKNNVNILEDKYRVSINWGGYSMIQATINLLKEAHIKTKSDYFVLLSGVDYPIRSNKCIKNFFKENNGKNFINSAKMPEFGKSLDRVEFYYFEGVGRNRDRRARWIRRVNRLIIRIGIRRKFPKEYSNYKFYAGNQWFAFTESFVAYLLSYIDNNKKFVAYFKHTYIPDEMFFQIILMNSPFKETCHNTVMYTDWSLGRPPYPSLIEEVHLPILATGFFDSWYGTHDILFARKFSDNSTLVIDEIDKLRNMFESSIATECN